MHTQL